MIGGFFAVVGYVLVALLFGLIGISPALLLVLAVHFAFKFAKRAFARKSKV